MQLDGAGSQCLMNLRAFAKLYGYVRYFHPSDETASIDWDAFALYGAEKVKNLSSTAELKAALEELFAPIAPTLQILRGDEQAKPFPTPLNPASLKIVAWQHKGLGFGVWNIYGEDSPYCSVRLNRRVILGQERPSRSGGIVRCLGNNKSDSTNPVFSLRGREFKLTLAGRAEVSDLENNHGTMWLRVDTDKGRNGFFSNNTLISSPVWSEYSIAGRVDTNATLICFGCLLSGQGKVWVDDIRLVTRPSASAAWKPLPLANPDFEEYTTTGSGRRAYRDWEGVDGGYVVTPNNDAPHHGEYAALIEYKFPEERSRPRELFAARPKASEILIKQLDGDLRCALPIALYDSNTTTLGSTEKSKATFTNLLNILASSTQIKTARLEQEPVRLANVIITWNVMQHFYPYFDIVGTNWDSVLTATLSATLDAPSTEHFIKIMRRMMVALGDGHAEYISGRKEFVLNARVENIEGKPVVTASRDSLLKRGDVIVRIHGEDAQKLLNEEEPLISGSTQWKRADAIENVITRSATKDIQLSVNRDGTLIDIATKGKIVGSVTIYEHPALERLQGFSVNDAVWYIDLSQVSMATLESKAADIARAKGVIFDMRGYPQNDNVRALGYVTTLPLLSPRWQIPQIMYPDGNNAQRYDTSGRWSVQPRTPRWEGKAVFLTGGGAISQAEDIMSIVEHYKLGEIVGETTAGADGNINLIRLPGGSTIRWTGMKVLKQGGSQLHLIGIKPTIPAMRTLQGIREGRDELVEKAIHLINASRR